jgi:hypothetical protein
MVTPHGSEALPSGVKYELFAKTHDDAIEPFRSAAVHSKFPILSLHGPWALVRGLPLHPARIHVLPEKTLRCPSGKPPPLMQF